MNHDEHLDDGQLCPECGNATRERDGIRECFSIWAGGIELSCGWAEEPMLDLAPPP